MKPQQLLFVDRYLATFNATRAYLQSGYRGGASDAARLLRNTRVQATIAVKLAPKMLGDEALARISVYARFDVRKLFPDDKRFRDLPDDVALCVKSVTQTKYGLRIEVHDAMRAAEVLAKADGKLRDVVQLDHTLEDILAGANQLEEREKAAKQLEPGGRREAARAGDGRSMKTPRDIVGALGRVASNRASVVFPCFRARSAARWWQACRVRREWSQGAQAGLRRGWRLWRRCQVDRRQNS